MNPLDELRKVLPPPKRPLRAIENWSAIEAELGMPLPNDYKAFISVYGSGVIGRCLTIQNPFDWVEANRDVREAWIGWASFYPDIAVYGEVIPYPVFPEPGGLLPFGNLGDVNILNWLTYGEPDAWPFVYYDRDDGFFQVNGLSSVRFIFEAVTQRSPLIVRMRSESAFDPPCEFVADQPDPKWIRMVSQQRLSVNAVVEQLLQLWLPEQVRVRTEPERTTLLVEPLDGSITISQDGGDDRTFLYIRYDAAHEAAVSDILGLFARLGFAKIEYSTG